MNTPRFAELGRQSRAPSPAKASHDAPAPEDQETQPGPKPETEKEDEMADTVDTNSKDYLAGQSAGESATRKAERERASTILASEHFAGREAMASKLLASEMSAEAIIDVLAAAPLATKAADETTTTGGDEELSQGREMLDQMKQNGNADLGTPSGGEKPTGKAAAASVWSRARAANSKN